MRTMLFDQSNAGHGIVVGGPRGLFAIDTLTGVVEQLSSEK